MKRVLVGAALLSTADAAFAAPGSCLPPTQFSMFGSACVIGPSTHSPSGVKRLTPPRWSVTCTVPSSHVSYTWPVSAWRSRVYWRAPSSGSYCVPRVCGLGVKFGEIARL